MVAAEETKLNEEILEQLREEHTFCYDEVSTSFAVARVYPSDTSVVQGKGIPSTTFSVLMVGLAKMLAIRVPSHRLRIIANMIYDGFYDGFGVDNSTIPLKNTRTGDEMMLQGLANNVVIEYQDRPRRSM